MRIPLKFSVGIVLTSALLQGCGDTCDGHGDGDIYCKGSTVMQCRQGSGLELYSCGSDECLAVPGKATTCVIPGFACPTSNPGYQCMGERRIECLANGQVADDGSCSFLTESQVRDGEGPYCVENPGGTMLACSWKRETCAVEGEVRCFDNGSAICKGNVYLDFKSNSEAGQQVCDVTRVDDCWNGRTWCAGDVLKRCDKCLDSSRCLKVFTEAVCEPGACTGYKPPAWLVEAKYDLGDPLPMGCAVDAPDCSGSSGMVCVAGAPGLCAGAGKAVVAMSCAEIQSVMGVHAASDGSPTITEYGPYCVERVSNSDVICAQDKEMCEAGQYRCDPLDITGKTLQQCSNGVWLRSQSCDQPGGSPPTTICASTTSYSVCQ